MGHRAHRLVVGAANRDHRGARGLNGLDTCSRDAVGDIHACRASGVTSGLGHGPPVVAFAGADQRRARANLAAVAEGGHGKRRARGLEGIQAESLGLVLDQQTRDAELASKSRQCVQGSRRELRPRRKKRALLGATPDRRRDW